MPWTAEDDEFISGKKPTARSPWQLFKDSFLSGALHSPAGAEGVVRRGAKLSGKTDEEINAAERRLTEQFQQRSQQDDAAFEDVDTLSPANIGRRAVELFGNILGGADPTYAINPGKSIAQKAGAQGAINAGMDAAAQVIEKRRGVRDKIDPDQIALSGAGGVVLGGGSELIARGARGRNLNLDSAVSVGKKFGRITSTYRTPAHNKKVGGVKNSYHTKSQAIDIARGKGVTHKQIENAYRRAGFDIIESLDEGDHSHLAFNFKKSKAEIKEREAKVKERTSKMATMDADELEAQFARDQAELDGLINDVQNTPDFDTELKDLLSKVNSGEIDEVTANNIFNDIEGRIHEDEWHRLGWSDHEIEVAKLTKGIPLSSKLRSQMPPEIAKIHDDLNRDKTPSIEEAQALRNWFDNRNIKQFPIIPRAEAIRNRDPMTPFDDKLNQAGKDLEEGKITRQEYNAVDALWTEAYKRSNRVGPGTDNPNVESFSRAKADKEYADILKARENLKSEDRKRLAKVEGSYWDARKILDTIDALEARGERYPMTLQEWREMMNVADRRDLLKRMEENEMPKELIQAQKDLIEIMDEIETRIGMADNGISNIPIKAKGNKPKGLGKGSVATTPVNDLRVDRSQPPPRPPFPGEKGFPKPGEPGNRGGPKGGDDTPDSRTPTDKLWQALNDARPLNREQKRLVSEERSKRLAKVFAARKTSQGEKGFFKELSQLKGDMPDVDFTSIRDKFTQPEIDHLHDLIKSNPFFTGFDAINAREGLQKMLKGKLPTDSELVLLARAYPKQIIEALKKMRPWKKRVLEQVNNLVNLPRSIMSSFDISFGGRQGIFLIGRKQFWNSYKGTMKRISSDKEFQAMQREIASRPSHELMKKGGLDLMEIHSLPSEREESFMSDWATKLPGVSHSSRAYIGYLNRLRADMFDDLTTKFVKLGIPLDDKLLRDTARYINTATGRGNLGSFSQAATILSNVLFSPRLLASRINLLNPAFYVSLSAPVRKEAIKDLLSFSSAAASVLGLASMVPGVTVSMDTNSSDWGKIKIGNTRLDVMGGFQQYIKLGSQLLTGKKTNSRGEEVEFNDPKKFAGTTYATAILDFLRSKLSPSAGYAVDAAHGKNIIGEPFDVKWDSLELFMPLWMQDVYEAVQEHGKVGALAGIPAILGVGVQTYKPRPAKEKKVNKFPSDNFDKKFKKMDLEELDKRFTH